MNNAAIRDRRPLQEITAAAFRRLIETNLVAQYELARVAARHMAARGHGRLVFVSSMVGAQSFQGDPAYVASKGGLEALMRALAVELGAHGVGVNAIAPGRRRLPRVRRGVLHHGPGADGGRGPVHRAVGCTRYVHPLETALRLTQGETADA